jgi:ribosomal protein L32
MAADRDRDGYRPDAVPHAPRCNHCGREKARNRVSPWCERCERKRARLIRYTAASLVAALTREDRVSADALLNSIVRLASWPA